MAAPDRNEFRQTRWGLLPTGVTVVSAFQASGPAARPLPAVCSLPWPMMMCWAVCLDLGSPLWRRSREAGLFRDLGPRRVATAAAEMFATKADQEKWSSVVWREHLEVPIIEGSLARVVCDLAK